MSAVQQVLPDLLHKQQGALLFTSAASARYPIPLTANLGVAMGSLRNYVHVLSQDLKTEGIHVGIVLVSGWVVPRGQAQGPGPGGFPLVAAEDVADAHWQMYQDRKQTEVIVGDTQLLKKASSML